MMRSILAILVAHTFVLGCGKDEGKALLPKDPLTNPTDGDGTAAIPVKAGEEFSMKGPLQKDAAGGYSLKQAYKMTVETSGRYMLQNRGSASTCTDDAATGPEYTIENGAGTLRLATIQTDGYTLLDGFSFPGQLEPGEFTLVVSWTSPSACEVYGSTLILIPDDFGSIAPPAPAPVPAPAPAPSNQYVGKWLGGMEGLYSDVLTINANGTGSQVVTVQGETVMDAGFSLVVDGGASPARVLMTITRITGGDAQVGDKAYCIAEVTGTRMRFECSDGNQYPTSFSSEAQTYTRSGL